MIEIDAETDEFLSVAARVAAISKGQVVAQLVALAKAEPNPTSPAVRSSAAVTIHADYEGHRTSARYIRGPGRIEILDGPLADTSYKTPSEAAREVVKLYNPSVTANRNGWTFWSISESGDPLQTIRYDDI
jgi:hypothetical protein